jgi:hypothetical protein
MQQWSVHHSNHCNPQQQREELETLATIFFSMLDSAGREIIGLTVLLVHGLPKTKQYWIMTSIQGATSSLDASVVVMGL